MVFDSQQQQTDSDFSMIKDTALRYLARREHSRLEITQKLKSKFSDYEKISAAVDYVESKGYLSDERYADLIVRSRINANYGPLKIRMELSAKGVSSDIVESVIKEYDVDWGALALKARIKHFGSGKPIDSKNQLKQLRYLKNRGFHQDHLDMVY